MRIGIDISSLCNQWDGIGTYTLDVIRYIVSHSSEDEYFLYAKRGILTELDLDKRFHLHTDNEKSHLFWLLTHLPRYAKRDRLDVLWQPNYILPFRVRGMRNVVTVHDMSAYAYREFASVATNITQKVFLKRTCKLADTILAISRNGAADMEKYIPEAKGKTEIIYNGKRLFKNDLDASEQECNNCLKKYGIEKNEYLLFVGTLSPRKNAEVIIKGYFNYRDQGGTKKLVLAGKIAPTCEHIRYLIEESKYREDIVVAGYISELEKRIFYYHASMLLFPSRLEGFGFPLLEAMQAQIPVITSNCSCMPEIAGDAAVYINDINSPNELSTRIFDVEKMDEELKALLIKRGLERVRYFDEMNYPKRTLQELTKRYNLSDSK